MEITAKGGDGHRDNFWRLDVAVPVFDTFAAAERCAAQFMDNVSTWGLFGGTDCPSRSRSNWSCQRVGAVCNLFTFGCDANGERMMWDILESSVFVVIR